MLFVVIVVCLFWSDVLVAEMALVGGREGGACVSSKCCS